MFGDAATVVTRRAPLSKPKQILALTGLRFFAAGAVVLYHVVLPRVEGTWPLALTNVLRGGFTGVSLFFVLSGFILTYTYLFRTSAEERVEIDAKRFWLARIARVYPVYLVALGLAAPFFIAAMAHGNATLPAAIRSALLTPLLLQAWDPSTVCNWNCPGWSLSVEAFFYLLFPMMVVLIEGNRERALVLVALGGWMATLGPAIGYMALAPDHVVIANDASRLPWLTVLKYNPLLHLGEFVLGIATGLLYLRRRRAERPVLMNSLTLLAVVIILAVLAAGSRVPYPLRHNGLLAPAFAVLIYALACGGSAMSRVLAWKPFVRLGEASYAIYLIHVTLADAIESFRRLVFAAQPSMLAWLTMYFCLLGVSSLAIFRYIEEPARRRINGRQRQLTREEPPQGVALIGQRSAEAL